MAYVPLHAASWLEQVEVVLDGVVRQVAVTSGVVDVRATSGAGVLAASGHPLAARLVELEFALGEGPAIEAFATLRPVLAGDLGETGARWPAFTASAAAAGAQAVFAFPLHVGAARFGVALLCSELVLRLSPDDVAVALVAADRIVTILLDTQGTRGEGLTHGSGAGLGRDQVAGLQGLIMTSLDHRREIYQAQGMVMVDLGVGLGDALSRLRAHAFAIDRPLQEVAYDVIHGRLILARDRPTPLLPGGDAGIAAPGPDGADAPHISPPGMPAEYDEDPDR